MFFIYATKEYQLKVVDLHDQICPKCKNRGVMKMIFKQYYSDSLLFSTFPYHKFAVLYCDKCEYEFPVNRWTDDLKQLRKQELKKLKTPKELKKGFLRLALLFFVPIISFALFLTYQTSCNKLSTSANRDNLKVVEVNDVFFSSFQHDKEKGSYGLIKIIATNPEETIIQEYSKRYRDIEAVNDIENKELNQNEFNSPKIILKTQNLIKYRSLLEPDKPASDAMFGTVHYKIEH